MASRLRAGTLAAAALLAPIAAASPALAARPVITAAYCTELGGVFSRHQGARWCIIPTNIRYQTLTDYTAPEPVPGLVATWTQIVGQQESTLLAQKGNGAVQTTELVSGFYVSLDVTDQTCDYDDGTDQTPAAVSLCEAAGLYPAEF